MSEAKHTALTFESIEDVLDSPNSALQLIGELQADRDALLKALEAAHSAGEFGGWENCLPEDNCLCCESWRKARSLRDEAIQQVESHKEH